MGRRGDELHLAGRSQPYLQADGFTSIQTEQKEKSIFRTDHKIEIMFLTPSLEPLPLVLYSCSDFISVLYQISRISVESPRPSKGFVELKVQDVTPVKHISANVHFYYYFLFFFLYLRSVTSGHNKPSCCVTAAFTELLRLSSSWLVSSS